MSRIILDFGSATTCKNDKEYIKRMIDELATVDSRKHEVIIKWQLFEAPCEVLDPPVVPLKRELFKYAYDYAKEKGYQTTASVFDLDSLNYLLTYPISFVKLANRPDLYWLTGEVPRKIPVYVSVSSYDSSKVRTPFGANVKLMCVSKYPANIKEYEKDFFAYLDTKCLGYNDISDHTTTFEFYNKYQPKIVEWHYKLSDSTGYDAGEFARTPEQLREIL